MSPSLLGFVWLAASLIVGGIAAIRLQPMRDRAQHIADTEHRHRMIARLDAAMAACIALFVTAVAYQIFGVLVPALVGWSTRLLVDILIVLPLISLAAMMTFARPVPDRLAPSWRAYGGYLWRVGVLLAVLVVLPVVLAHAAAPAWLYPTLLLAACVVTLLDAFRKARSTAKPYGSAP